MERACSSRFSDCISVTLQRQPGLSQCCCSAVLCSVFCSHLFGARLPSAHRIPIQAGVTFSACPSEKAAASVPSVAWGSSLHSACPFPSAGQNTRVPAGSVVETPAFTRPLREGVWVRAFKSSCAQHTLTAVREPFPVLHPSSLRLELHCFKLF